MRASIVINLAKQIEFVQKTVYSVYVYRNDSKLISINKIKFMF